MYLQTNKLFLFYYIAVQVTFVPSPNIGVYQLAHYQCLVDSTSVSIAWLVNGTGSGHNDIIQLGIITNGAGSSKSSLIIPGYPQFNNTEVRCIASESDNINNYINLGNSILIIQGNTL